MYGNNESNNNNNSGRDKPDPDVVGFIVFEYRKGDGEMSIRANIKNKGQEKGTGIGAVYANDEGLAAHGANGLVRDMLTNIARRAK